MTSLMSFNVLAQYVHDKPRLINWVQANKPKYLVLCDDDGSIANQTRGYTTNIRRAVAGNDATVYASQSPQDWLTARAALAAQGDWLYVLNEPAGYGDLDTLVKWLIEVMRIAKNAGIHCVVGNWGVGSPDEKLIENGTFDALAAAIGDWHVLGLHEYFKNDAAAEAPWLCGRCSYWLERYPHLPIVLTEHGRDVGGGRNDGWQGTGWGESGYETRLSAAAPVCENLPRCLFCWGYGAGNQWLSFDVQSTSDAFLAFVASFQEATVTPILAPVPQLTSATVTATADPSGANIRAAATTSSAIIGKLHVGDHVMYLPMVIQGGVYSVGSAIRHDWLALGQGYVAKGVITLKDVPSTPVKPAPASVIDVSEAQGVIDWKTVAAAGVHTAFIRATQGLATVDEQFVANVTGALAAGLKVGLYHAYLPNDNADVQASNFLKAVAPYRFKLTYPLIVDVERQNGMTPTQVADGLLTLLNVLDGATGQKSWIYTGQYTWNTYVGAQHDAVFSQRTLWVANYTSASKPAMPRCWSEGNWVFWQYSSTGKVAGIDEKHNVDLDRAHP